MGDDGFSTTPDFRRRRTLDAHAIDPDPVFAVDNSWWSR
jgi:hypothetical protein